MTTRPNDNSSKMQLAQILTRIIDNLSAIITMVQLRRLGKLSFWRVERVPNNALIKLNASVKNNNILIKMNIFRRKYKKILDPYKHIFMTCKNKSTKPAFEPTLFALLQTSLYT